LDVAAIIIAIVAILLSAVLAGFGILIQLQTHKATAEQSERAARNIADMRTEIHGLVGELRGMTERMVEAQERQFNRMLDAFVTRPAAAEEVAAKTGESADRLQQISEEMDALKEEMRRAASADEVQHKLDELASRVEAVSESTSRAARLAEAAARPPTPFTDKALQEQAYRTWRMFQERAVEPTEGERET
jgi:methyl-accepting chemotaxis protein